MIHKFLILRSILFIGVCLVWVQGAYGQVDSSNLGWKISLNTGLFLSSNHPASFYNGDPQNDNRITFVLDNKYIYEEIMGLLEASDTFILSSLPSQMRYNPSLLVGFTFRKNFREDLAWFLNFNQVTLRATDFYTLEVDPLDNIATDPDIRQFAIWGEEQRYLFDFGLSKEFESSSPMFRPFFEGGITLTNTLVKANKIKVYDRDFSLVNIYGNNPYIPNSNMQTYDVDQGGIGYGGFLNAGIKCYVNHYFSIDPTMHFYLATTHLKPYDQIRPHFFFNIRLTVNNLFAFQEKHLGKTE